MTISIAPIMLAITNFHEQVDYPIVVMGLDKKLTGRVRKAYHAEFTEAERAVIARYNKRFRQWYLVTGSPQVVHIRPGTLGLLQRAVNFFASV